MGADLSLCIKSHSAACECSLGQECRAETCQDTYLFFLSGRNVYWEICQLFWVCSKARGDLRTPGFSAGLVGSERPGSVVGFEPTAWAPRLRHWVSRLPGSAFFCLRFFCLFVFSSNAFSTCFDRQSSISVSCYCGA